MSAVGAPPAPPKPKVKLPFKRTVKRKSSDTFANDPTATKPGDDSAQSLFEQSPGAILEKLAKNQKSHKQRLAGNEKESTERKLSRDPSERKLLSAKKRSDSETHVSKRRRVSLSSEKGDEDARFRLSPRKSSQISIKSPSRSRTSDPLKSTPPSSRSNAPSSKLPAGAHVIDLEDSDGEYSRTPSKSKGKAIVIQPTLDDDISIPAVHDTDDDDDLQIADSPTVVDDITRKWVIGAKLRMEQKKEEARPDLAAQILVESRVAGLPNALFKIQLSKRMNIVHSNWMNKMGERIRDRDLPIDPSIIKTMFFTWKGNKVFDFTTLESLGIKLIDKDGNLCSAQNSEKEGFKDRDKVYFEAWTPALYEQYQADREKTRKRLRGEDVEDEEEEQPEPEPEDKRIKVILKSRDYGTHNVGVPPSCPVKTLVKFFRQRTKDQVPANANITIHFDGQPLGEEETVEDVGIEDMEMLEVHIR